jgi:hypothetical protein
VVVDGWLANEEATPVSDAQRRMVQVLRDEAIATPGSRRFFFPLWAERWLLQ